MNCYGIPSSILRVREYGGTKNNEKPQYEISRKFTRFSDLEVVNMSKPLGVTLQEHQENQRQ